MDDVNRQVVYVMWRHMMWSRGCGSYDDIERLVRAGKLIPGKKYPAKEDDLSLSNDYECTCGRSNLPCPKHAGGLDTAPKR